MLTMRIKVTLTEDMLATCPNNPEIHKEYIASKGPDARSIEEEVAATSPEKVEKKQMTVFPLDAKKKPFLWNYQFKGFIKEAASVLSRIEGTHCGELSAFRKVIDGIIFVTPRRIPIVLPKGKKIGELQRPLRGQTAQGERISLAHSQTVPAGSIMTIDIKILGKLKEKGGKAVDLRKILQETLDYGCNKGLLQWRNGGFGTFEWKEV